MAQAPKVPGYAFYAPHSPGGFMVWALFGGEWRRYQHVDDEDTAKRWTNKTSERLRKCAKLRQREGITPHDPGQGVERQGP